MRGGAARTPVAIESPARSVLRGGPLEYTLRRSRRARRLRVVIDPSRGILVTIPLEGGVRGRFLAAVDPFLGEHEEWIRRQVARHVTLRSRWVAHGPLGEGAALMFRGQVHRIAVRSAGAALRSSTVSRDGLDEGDVLVVSLASSDGRDLRSILIDWLRVRARSAIEQEVTRHAPALRVRPASISVRDQRTRWGSCSRSGRLAFSWRLVLAPPEALETVVIHELAHLQEFGHGPDFWALVASRRPDHLDWRRWLRRHSQELHAAFPITPTRPEHRGAAGGASARGSWSV